MARSFFYITIKQSSIHVLNRSANTSISFTDSINDLKGYFIDQVRRTFKRNLRIVFEIGQ